MSFVIFTGSCEDWVKAIYALFMAPMRLNSTQLATVDYPMDLINI